MTARRDGHDEPFRSHQRLERREARVGADQRRQEFVGSGQASGSSRSWVS